MNSDGTTALLRLLPKVQLLLEHQDAARLRDEFGAQALRAACRQIVDDLRHDLLQGRIAELPTSSTLVSRAGWLLAARRQPYLRPVLNATGIVLHTNLGRAPLAREAVDAVARVGAQYSNLEYDLNTGLRGSRTAGVEGLLCALTGAEAALAVNNGAAAILLALAALGGGGEVIVSRGELVEIGGGFRIPDVIRQGGAALVEVGSTNKTRPADYAAAMTERTRVLLKVHQSNFRITGFTTEAGIGDLAILARPSGALVVADVGSGLLRASAHAAEPTLREALEAGADLVTCSGDKLLGGPQAGLIVGSARAVQPLRRHPLLRAVRLDKLSLAALEATLILHRDAPERVPVQRMLDQTEATLHTRATRLCQLLGCGEVVPTQAMAGGGSLPGEGIASRAVALPPSGGANSAAERLRAGSPSVVGRIHDGRLLLDVFAVGDDQIDDLAQAVNVVMDGRSATASAS